MHEHLYIMTLKEKILICDDVISALQTQSDMVSILSRLPMEQQLVGIKFMEFLNEDSKAENIDIIDDQYSYRLPGRALH